MRKQPSLAAVISEYTHKFRFTANNSKNAKDLAITSHDAILLNEITLHPQIPIGIKALALKNNHSSINTFFALINSMQTLAELKKIENILKEAITSRGFGGEMKDIIKKAYINKRLELTPAKNSEPEAPGKSNAHKKSLISENLAQGFFSETLGSINGNSLKSEDKSAENLAELATQYRILNSDTEDKKNQGCPCSMM